MKEKHSKTTPFQDAVFRLTSQIPRGKVSTYGAIHKALQQQGKKSAAIAVGQALRKNPFAPQVPCHRVIASDLSLGGYFGLRKNIQKEKILAEEGVVFENEKVKENYLFDDFN